MAILGKEDWTLYKKAIEENIKKMTMALQESTRLNEMADEELEKFK
jgi:hypothetical protein